MVSAVIRRQTEATEGTLFDEELEMAKSRLREPDKEQERLLDYHIMGFPEEPTKKQNATMNEKRRQLLERKTHLERQIDAQQECQVDLEGIERFCQPVEDNPKGLSFEDKRLALEALQTKVWIDGDDIEIMGAIPMPVEDDTMTMQSAWHRHNIHHSFPLSLSVATL